MPWMNWGFPPLTEGCYFISISPERVRSLLTSFEALDLNGIPHLTEDAKEWIKQWQAALEYARAKGLGVIGHCG